MTTAELLRIRLVCRCDRWSGCSLADLLFRLDRKRALKRHVEESLMQTLAPRMGRRKRVERRAS